MKWVVQFSSRAGKQVKQLNLSIESILRLLIEDLSNNGPFPGNGWPNYGKLDDKKNVDRRHCHLKKGKRLKILEVYYVECSNSSRKNLF